MTDQQKAELAMEWAGLWKRERCEGPFNLFLQPPGRVCEHDQRAPHDIPCPDPLHDDAVAMRLLEAMFLRESWHSIYKPILHELAQLPGDDVYIEGDLRLAIVRAAAALAEQEKTLPR